MISDVLSSVMRFLLGKKKKGKALILRRDFPKWAKDVCYEELENARRVIERVGKHKVIPQSVKVEFVLGTRKFNTTWAWLYEHKNLPDGGMWIAGICNGDGRIVQVAIDPDRVGDAGAVRRDILMHEFVHHWLSACEIYVYHDPAYDDYVMGWAGSRNAVGKSRSGERFELDDVRKF